MRHKGNSSGNAVSPNWGSKSRYTEIRPGRALP